MIIASSQNISLRISNWQSVKQSILMTGMSEDSIFGVLFAINKTGMKVVFDSN